MAQSTMILTPVPLASVPTPPAGKFGFFLSDGTDGGYTANALYKMDSVRATTAMIPAAYTDENAQDAVGAILTDSASIDFTYDDAGNTITAVVVTEAIQDIIGALIAAGDGTIVVTYSDAGNTLTIGVGTITSAKVSDFTEAAQDAIGALFADSSELDVTYTDAGNAETITLIDNTIGRSRLVQPVQSRILGRASGAGTGIVTDLTDDQVQQILNEDIVIRSLTAGSAPAALTTEQILATFTLPATWAPPAGAVYEVYASGAATQTAAAVLGTFRLKIGAVGAGVGAPNVAQELSSTAILARANAQWTLRAIFTIRSIGAGGSAAGSIEAGGQFMRGATATVTTSAITPPVAVDTTQARDVMLTWTWAAATVSARTIDQAFIQRIA